MFFISPSLILVLIGFTLSQSKIKLTTTPSADISNSLYYLSTALHFSQLTFDTCSIDTKLKGYF